jgi:hypothetical protein
MERNYLSKELQKMTDALVQLKQEKKKQRNEARMERNCLSKELQKMTDALVQLRQENREIKALSTESQNIPYTAPLTIEKREELLKECDLNGSLSPAENVSSTPETETKMSEGSLSLSETSKSEG